MKLGTALEKSYEIMVYADCIDREGAEALKVVRDQVFTLRGVLKHLIDAADDLAYCHIAADVNERCGTCFGCHLLFAKQNAEKILSEDM